MSIWQESQWNSNSSTIYSRKHDIPQYWDCYYSIIAAHVRMQNVHFLSVGWYPYNQHTGRHINTQATLQLHYNQMATNVINKLYLKNGRKH